MSFSLLTYLKKGQFYFKEIRLNVVLYATYIIYVLVPVLLVWLDLAMSGI